MKRILTFLACLFFLFTPSLATSVETGESEVSCLIYYDGYPEEPQCEVIIDDEGEEVEECAVESPPASGAELTPEESSLIIDGFSMASFTFYGECNCVVKYYKGSTASGCSVKHEFTSEDYNIIATEEVVSWRPNSFAFECQF